MKNKWLMFFVLLLSAVTVGVTQLKVAAVMGAVAEMLGVEITRAALLMSLFTVAGIVLAIPGAAIMAKTGPKKLLLGLMACLVAGNALGAVTTSFEVMMLSRVIEGIAYALIIMVGIELINAWFRDGGASTATGIFNTFAAIANFVAMNAAIAILGRMGLRAIWWLLAALSAVCFLLVLVFVREPERAAAQAGAPADKPSIAEAAKNVPVLVMALAQFCIAFVLFSFITCYPQLFTGFYGLAETQANFFSSLNGLFGIPFCILCGIVVEKTGKPFVVALVGAVGCIALCLTLPYLGPSTYVVHVLLSAICPGGLVMTSVFIIVPQLAKRPSLIGYSMSFINLMYYIGVFLCTPVVLSAAEGPGGWKGASLIMTAFSVSIVVLLLVAASLSRKARGVGLQAARSNS